MATRNIVVTYPDGAASRITDALRDLYGPVEDPPGSRTFRPRTNAEVFNLFEQGVRDQLRDLVRNYERSQAVAAVQSVSIT